MNDKLTNFVRKIVNFVKSYKKSMSEHSTSSADDQIMNRSHTLQNLLEDMTSDEVVDLIMPFVIRAAESGIFIQDSIELLNIEMHEGIPVFIKTPDNARLYVKLSGQLYYIDLERVSIELSIEQEESN